MKFITTVGLLVTAFTLVDARYRPKRLKKPNVVFIMGDDIGFNDVGWNNPLIYTPHMNQLAKNGIIFDNYYAMPLCTPSRATFMTGRYAQELGLQRNVLGTQEPYGIPLSFPLLSNVLKSRGDYETHAIGKWHLGYCDEAYTPTKRGYNSFLGFYNGAEENYFHCLSKFNIYRPLSNCSGLDFRENLTVGSEYNGQYSGYIYGARAVEIIKNHDSNTPFFMYVAVTDPHFPLQAPERFEKHCQNNPNTARKNFCATMAAIDELVSNVTNALKEANLYDNTILIFSSDNGGSTHFGGNNYPLRGEKNTLWEGGCRVPAFIHSPLLKRREVVSEDMFHIIDWFPTILHAAGIHQGNLQLSGVSQWSAMNGECKPVRNEFPYSYDVYEGTVIAAIRVGDWKLIAGPGGNDDKWVTENETTDYSFDPDFLTDYVSIPVPYNTSDTTPKLFNLKDDPYERNNLASSRPDKVQELLSRLEFYKEQAKPAVKMSPDPAGDPDNFGKVYTPGWCEAFDHVPSGDKDFMNQLFHYID